MADFEGDKGCGPTHHACECFMRQLREAQGRAEAAETALLADAEADVALTARVLQAETALAEQRALAERLEKQVAGQKRTLHKVKGKWDKSQLRVVELERLVIGASIEALAEVCKELERTDAHAEAQGSPQSGQEEGD